MNVSDKYLMAISRRIVGLRAGWKCEFPGCNAYAEDLNHHHWFSRDNQSVRYDPDNGIWLCSNHHTGLISAHREPMIFEAMIIYYHVRTVEWLQELTVKKNIIVKNNNSFREYWKEKLQEELGRLAA